MKSDTVHIGVDVSKEKLDVFVPAQKEGMRPKAKELHNNVTGFKELRDLARKAKATVCVEPTVGYELELIAFMHRFDAGLDPAVDEPFAITGIRILDDEAGVVQTIWTSDWPVDETHGFYRVEVDSRR
jgi:hypothetical protein